MTPRSEEVFLRPVGASSSAVFRIAFGIVGVVVALRYLRFGWVGTLLVDPPRHFTYPGFGWVRPLPEPAMTLVIVALGIAAVGIALGYRYRLAAAGFCVALSYVELIDRTLYINHYYWLALTAALMIALPLNRVWSLDARRARQLTGLVEPSTTASVPMLVVILLRFQVGMVYAFAGIAKLNADWLLHGEPLATWLGARTGTPLIGAGFASGWLPLALCWASAAFDLTIVVWLSWRRTRLVAFTVLVAFHATTWLLFPTIGVFPLVMTLGALVFFAPDWPERLSAALGRSVHRGHRRPRTQIGRSTNSSNAVPSSSDPYADHRGGPSRWIMAAASVYVLTMIVVPLRGQLAVVDGAAAGSPAFTWSVMRTERAGSVTFRVVDPGSGDAWIVDGPEGLTRRQLSAMAIDADLIRQASLMIEADWVAAGFDDVAVYADAVIARNGRRHTRFLDPTIDLTRVGDTSMALLGSR